MFSEFSLGFLKKTPSVHLLYPSTLSLFSLSMRVSSHVNLQHSVKSHNISRLALELMHVSFKNEFPGSRPLKPPALPDVIHHSSHVPFPHNLSGHTLMHGLNSSNHQLLSTTGVLGAMKELGHDTKDKSSHFLKKVASIYRKWPHKCFQ